jgi:valyl-tRNA synthetase
MLISTDYPSYGFPVNPEAINDVQWIISLVTALRASRSELNVPASAKLSLFVQENSVTTTRRLGLYKDILMTLGRISEIHHTPAPPQKGLISIVSGDATFGVPLGETIDFEAESVRLKKEIQRLEKEIGSVHNKLNNADFLAKAKPEVIQENRDRLVNFESTKERLVRAVNQLEA